MVADGNKKMKAKLEISPYVEMKKDVIKWLESEPKAKKIFGKKIVYEESLELNPKKWTEPKLKSAMAGLVRPELKLLAVRAGAIMKDSEKAKSPKEHNKIITALEQALKNANSEISEKCSDALEELSSGKGEAKAGLAVGKKAMSEINSLDIGSVFKDFIAIATGTADGCVKALEKGDKAKIGKQFSAAHAEIEKAIKNLEREGKKADSVAKFLLNSGKKLKGNDIGSLDAFSGKIRDKKVHGPLEKLSNDMDSLEKELDAYAKDLKKGQMEVGDAKAYAKKFGAMSTLQGTADSAVKAMKSLQVEFKKVEKDLK